MINHKFKKSSVTGYPWFTLENDFIFYQENVKEYNFLYLCVVLF